MKCYIVTRETVLFGSNLGLDELGRECRPFTAALLGRLEEYTKGIRAKQIAVAEPMFFDVRTGEPNVWYSRNAGGIIKLFDLIGFDPESGQELIPVTPEIVTAWKSQRSRPERVDPEKYGFFDPVTGEPRIW